MRKKTMCPSRLLTMIFFIFLQIFLNLYSTVIDNDAYPTPDNDYWYRTKDLSYETLQLPATVHPVILDYYPLTPAGVRSKISEIIKECKEKNVSKSDFNELQIYFVKMLVTWKYNHNIEMLNGAIAEAKVKQESLKTHPEGSSENANYQTLYETFLQPPVFDDEIAELWPPRKLKDFSRIPSNFKEAVKNLPFWCRFKTRILMYSIEHFPEKWHIYSYRRLAKALEYYYSNKRKIDDCTEIDEHQKSICMRENEGLLALNLASEVSEYTSYFEKNEPWSKEVDIGQVLTLKLESFTYPDILVLAQGLPSDVHQPLKDLYECFRKKRREHADSITNSQKLLLETLLKYVDEENANVVADDIKQKHDECEEFETTMAGPSLLGEKKAASNYSPSLDSFTVQNPPSTLRVGSKFKKREPPKKLASEEEDNSADETPKHTKISMGGSSMSFKISGHANVINPVQIGSGTGSMKISNVYTRGNVYSSETIEYPRGTSGSNRSNSHHVTVVETAKNSPRFVGQGSCNVLLENLFYRKFFENSPQ